MMKCFMAQTTTNTNKDPAFTESSTSCLAYHYGFMGYHYFFFRKRWHPTGVCFHCGRSLMVILKGQCQATLKERTYSQPSRTDLSVALSHITS